MKIIIKILLFFILLSSHVESTSIVDELTALNNLYKEGAISKEEFSKAKSILLKTKSEVTQKEKNNSEETRIEKKNKEILEKDIVKKEKKIIKQNNYVSENYDFSKDISNTFILLKEIDEIGNYKRIDRIPEGMFKTKQSPKGQASEAMMKMYDSFVRAPKLMEKYPDRMMKAMGYFEIFFNYELEKKKKSIENFKRNYPNIRWDIKNDIKTLYSLNKARKTMRESMGLNLNNTIEEALDRYMLMYSFLKDSKKIETKLSSKQKKLNKESAKFKKNYGSFKKTLELKSEKRIDLETFDKDLKKDIKKVRKSLKKLTNLDSKTNNLYLVTSDIFEKSLNSLNNCKPECNREELIKVIDTVNFNNAILKDAEKNLIKKRWTQNMDNLSMDKFSDEEIASISLVSNNLKLKKKKDHKLLQESILNIEADGFKTDQYLDRLSKEGFEIKSITMSYDTIDNMKRWAMKDWANSWRGELPEVKDKSGNLIEFTDENIRDIKAQLAFNAFSSLIDTPSLNETVSESIKEISNLVNNSSDFDLDSWLNQDFTITLNNYSQLVGNSLGVQLNDFDDLTYAVNKLYGSNMTSEEYADHWKSAQYLDSTSNWGDVTMGVDLIEQVGSFDAASIAKDLGADLQTVADSIYAAANVGVSTDLEAAAKGLGYNSFADAVAAYNEQYGTNYTEAEAREALGQ